MENNEDMKRQVRSLPRNLVVTSQPQESEIPGPVVTTFLPPVVNLQFSRNQVEIFLQGKDRY